MDLLSFALDFVLRVDKHLAEFVTLYGAWVYALLFAIIFVETGVVVMPFLPGDSLLFVVGALCGLGLMELGLVLPLLIVAAVAGDQLNYSIGRFFGVRLFANPDSKIFRRRHLEITQTFYARHGGKTIILARFVPIVRTFAPFVAGMGHMPYRRFAAYNVVGAIAWVTLFSYAGYFFGNLPMVQSNLHYLIVAIIFVSILPGVIEILRHRRATQGNT